MSQKKDVREFSVVRLLDGREGTVQIMFGTEACLVEVEATEDLVEVKMEDIAEVLWNPKETAE